MYIIFIMCLISECIIISLRFYTLVRDKKIVLCLQGFYYMHYVDKKWINKKYDYKFYMKCVTVTFWQGSIWQSKSKLQNYFYFTCENTFFLKVNVVFFVTGSRTHFLSPNFKSFLILTLWTSVGTNALYGIFHLTWFCPQI